MDLRFMRLEYHDIKKENNKMSGRKYTTISTDELQKLRDLAATAVTLANSNAALTALGHKTDALINDMRRRITVLNNVIDSLNSDMQRRDEVASKERQQLRRQLEESIRQTNRQLQDMQMRHQTEMENLDRQFHSDLARQRADTVHMINESNHRMMDALNGAVSALENQIGTVSSRLDTVERNLEETSSRVGILFNSDSSLLELAREYVDTAALLNNDTAQNYRVEILLPGRLQAVQNLVRSARDEIAFTQDGHPTNSSVARQLARRAAEAAMELHEDIICAEQEWQSHLQVARQAVAATQSQCIASENIKYPDTDVDVNVNRWSNGDLQRIRSRVDALEGQLNNPDRLTLSDLDGISDAAVQSANEVIESTVFAMGAFGASQDRVEIAQDVADNLMARLGTEIVSYGYQGNDQRCGHRVHLKNPMTGFEIVITQIPEIDGEGNIVNRLESDILNYGTCNYQEGERIAQEALDAIAELGFSQKPVSTVPGYQNRCSERVECADMDRWMSESVQAPAPVHQQTSGVSSGTGR